MPDTAHDLTVLAYSTIILTRYLDTQVSGLLRARIDFYLLAFLGIAFVLEQSLYPCPVDQAIAGVGEALIVFGRIGQVLKTTSGWSAVTYTLSLAAAVQRGTTVNWPCPL